MGSETVAAGEEKTEELDDLTELAFRRPKRQIVAMVRRAPRMIPGKNPTSTADAGNWLQCAAASAVPFCCCREVAVLLGLVDVDVALVAEWVGVVVGGVVADVDFDVVLEDFDVALEVCMTQRLF